MISALARPPLALLLRSRRTWIAAAGWGAVAVALAVAARSSGSAHPADHVLLGAYGPLILPLLTYALVGTVLRARSLSSSIAPVVSFGAPAVPAVAVAMLVTAGACTIAGALLAAGADVVAHSPGDPPLGRDALASAYAGGLGGAAYATWFVLGASFGKRGTGRPVLLALDWLFGANDGATALVTPRGHLRNLLGGAAPMDLSQRASACILIAIAIASTVIAARRARS